MKIGLLEQEKNGGNARARLCRNATTQVSHAKNVERMDISKTTIRLTTKQSIAQCSNIHKGQLQLQLEIEEKQQKCYSTEEPKGQKGGYTNLPTRNWEHRPSECLYAEQGSNEPER